MDTQTENTDSYAYRLERIAAGESWEESVLRVALDAPALQDSEREAIKRRICGIENSTDHIRLAEIAHKIRGYKPRLSDLARTTIHVPWGCGEPGWEAYDANLDGAYTNYHVCPPNTVLTEVETDYLRATVVQLSHADVHCAVIAEMHF